MFDQIEMIYNPKRKYTRNGMLSPVVLKSSKKTEDADQIWDHAYAKSARLLM